MSFLILGFLTSLSLILAIGPQNIFVIEQGIKKQHIFLICFICSVSDTILIFLGIFLFQYLGTYFNEITELIFNILLLIFLIYFIYTKISEKFKNIEIDTDFNSAHVSLEHHGEFDINTPDGKVRLIFDWLESTYLVEKDDELKFKFYFSEAIFDTIIPIN